ncbi:hypothetical protein BO83DRAFT_171430 [Aspergillus eucalypticola CBS 122712]|uniref:Uncharacterized protein n=1 Tax=Aspergillus eucalypticola (strain CBS 122712 / IBT 29274) TaxID=1448314 RepID=A0A317W412_ASPEC|nr:uncharacterized protein BO83DRAFT_171430 [Aspergillus eucalypticola CBS 122712]PWY81193.1 hypothetical protein BO83DRAFT_171430 [Aspergillus eucalypticola CBS 122712]
MSHLALYHGSLTLIHMGFCAFLTSVAPLVKAYFLFVSLSRSTAMLPGTGLIARLFICRESPLELMIRYTDSQGLNLYET